MTENHRRHRATELLRKTRASLVVVALLGSAGLAALVAGACDETGPSPIGVHPEAPDAAEPAEEDAGDEGGEAGEAGEGEGGEGGEAGDAGGDAADGDASEDADAQPI